MSRERHYRHHQHNDGASKIIRWYSIPEDAPRGSMRWRKACIIRMMEGRGNGGAAVFINIHGDAERTRWSDDDNVAWAALQSGTKDQIPEVLKRLSFRLRDDWDVVTYATAKSPQCLQYVSERHLDDIRIVRDPVFRHPINIKYVSEALKDDLILALGAVKGKADVVQYVSDRLRDNEELIYEAVSRDGRNIQYASNRLRDNGRVIGKAVTVDPDTIVYASERLRDNKRIVLAAVSGNGYNLRYASERLRDDKQIVHQAVSTSTPSLRFASTRLRDDKELAMFAVQNNPAAIRHLSERLMVDLEIIKLVAKHNCSSLLPDAVFEALKDDKEAQMSLIQICDTNLRRVVRRQKEKKKFILEVLERGYLREHGISKLPRPIIWHNIPRMLFSDYDVGMALVRLDGYFLNHLSPELKVHPEIFVSAISCEEPVNYRGIDVAAMRKKLCKLDQEDEIIGLSRCGDPWEVIWLVSRISLRKDQSPVPCEKTSSIPMLSHDENCNLSHKDRKEYMDPGVCRKVVGYAGLDGLVKFQNEMKKFSAAKALLEQYDSALISA